MGDSPSPFNTGVTGFLFFHHNGLSYAMPSTLVAPCHQLIGQIHWGAGAGSTIPGAFDWSHPLG